MADYGGAISLSQAHTSDDDSPEHSPRTLSATASGGGGGSSKSKTPSSSMNIITLHHPHQTPSSSDNSGARKPRGRPPGSKNRPKPPIVITRDSDSAMKPVILEVSAGSDIIDTIVSFARRNHVGVSILSATGTVSNVTLRHPVAHAPAMTLQGPFALLSLSGSFIAPQSSSSSPSPSALSSPLSCFGVTLTGGQGQVFGGIVGGKVMAATPVIVVAATYVNPSYHKLPSEEDNEDHQHQHHQHQHHHHGQQQQQESKAVGATESSSSTGMSMTVYGVASPTPLNCQISPDVMPWGAATSSRPY